MACVVELIGQRHRGNVSRYLAQMPKTALLALAGVLGRAFGESRISIAAPTDDVDHAIPEQRLDHRGCGLSALVLNGVVETCRDRLILVTSHLDDLGGHPEQMPDIGSRAALSGLVRMKSGDIE
ncbi:MAG: hypothetical protein NVSMB22_28560 [Chloroflexota bacterium]